MCITSTRLELHEVLCSILGTRNAYFQPPESMKLHYPCIRYQRSDGKTDFADDQPYITRIGYQLIVIDPDPDSEILAKVQQLPTCTWTRNYIANNLNHDVYNIYY